uniref:Ig-like domain-containing protein n=1 Tax=Clastoptera arizonana TaxID=38151 RepID=A0A1B6CAG6_9HEMI
MSEEVHLRRWFFFISLISLLLPQGYECLKLIRVRIPPYKIRGDTAVLECLYELEGASLYAVKWYKENEEFYRFVPRVKPALISYMVDGIKVDHKESGNTTVTLRAVNMKTTGNYRCEVSAEAPSFASVQDEGRMEVVYLPNSGPHITGERKQYSIGEEVDLNCTSAKSYPASVLHWYINDVLVTSREHLHPHPQVVHPHGLITTSLGLRVPVSSNLFLEGNMKIRCAANVSPVLWQGDQESIAEVDNREAMLLVRGFAARLQADFFKLGLLVSVFLFT